MLHDLGPYAAALGHPVIYANFWAAEGKPLAILASEIEDSYAQMVGARRAPMRTTERRSRAEIGTGGAKAAIETKSAPVADRGPDPFADLTELGQVAGKAPFLFLDEVQEIATMRGGAGVLKSLRTALDVHRNRFRVVFTGSNLYKLQATFDDRAAPFFQFAQRAAFPPLDEAFVRHLLRKATEATGRAFAFEEAWPVFLAFDRNPNLFRALVTRLISERGLSIAAAAGRVRADTDEDGAFRAAWVGFSDLDRAVLIALAEGVGKPYSARARARLTALGAPADVSPSRIQTALKRLAKAGHALAGVDGWTLADPRWRLWFAARAPDRR